MPDDEFEGGSHSDVVEHDGIDGNVEEVWGGFDAGVKLSGECFKDVAKAGRRFRDMDGAGRCLRNRQNDMHTLFEKCGFPFIEGFGIHQQVRGMDVGRRAQQDVLLRGIDTVGIGGDTRRLQHGLDGAFERRLAEVDFAADRGPYGIVCNQRDPVRAAHEREETE